MVRDNYAILKTKLILQRPMFHVRSCGKKRNSINSKWFLKTMIPSWVATNPWFHQRSMILALWQTPKSSLPVATKVGPYQLSVSSSLNSTFWGWNNPKKTQLCGCGWLLVPLLFGKCRNTPTHSKNGDICDVICIMISVESEIICINDDKCVYIDMKIILIIIRSHDVFLSKNIMGASSRRLILLQRTLSFLHTFCISHQSTTRRNHHLLIQLLKKNTSTKLQIKHISIAVPSNELPQGTASCRVSKVLGLWHTCELQPPWRIHGTIEYLPIDEWLIFQMGSTCR